MGTTATNDTASKISNIIWIEPNVDNEENKYYLKELKNIKDTKVSCYKNVKDALILIKKIKFSETNIIVNRSLYSEFIQKFEENVKDIFIIPKILIFTSNKEEFIENDMNFEDIYIRNYNSNDNYDYFNGEYFPFYYLEVIQASFDDLKNIILKSLPKPFSKTINKIEIIEENQLNFEYIDCKEKLVLPLLYQTLIEITSTDDIKKYTEYLYNKYSANEEINKLLNSIKNKSNIPIELLSKYYIRLYSLKSQFNNDINEELRGNQKDKYLSYIKIIYKGIKLKSLPLGSNNILYKGSKISNVDINKIKEYLKT